MDALRLLSRSSHLKAKDAKTAPQDTLIATNGQHRSNEATSGNALKRKREDSEPDDDARQSEGLVQSSEQEIRSLHKKHNIKIVDLNQFRAIGKTSESRKAQKEQSRIYPQPLNVFSEVATKYHAHTQLTRNIAEQAYLVPTEVQTATLPLLLEHSSDGSRMQPDLLTVAPTGSGKTLAFLIPLINKIVQAHRGSDGSAGRHVRAIILAPTKELVSQIVAEGRKLVEKTGVSITAVRKGMKMFEERALDGEDDDSAADTSDMDDDEAPVLDSILVKSDILVSTPLSLLHMLSPARDEDDKLPLMPLPNVNDLILDEADVLLDPLFRSQTLDIWAACTSTKLRISMWSATIGSNVEELAVQTILERQKRLKIGRKERPPLIRTIIGLKDTSLPTISHRLIYTSTEAGKLLGVRQLLRPSSANSGVKGRSEKSPPPRPPFLIFTQTIERAQALFGELQYDIPAEAGGSSRIAVLHSHLSQKARAMIMKSFRGGKIWVLITTDLLSRGIDFRGVNAVVNYDIPTTVAGYVHRAGRTGRAGREGGVCVSFYTKEDIQYVKGIANVIAASEKKQRMPESAVTDSSNLGSAKTESAPRSGIQPWLLHALPGVSKPARKDLKLHGVQSRRAIHADDDEKTKRMKRKAKIGTQSGYERREIDRKRGATEGSLRARRHAVEVNETDEWDGFG